MNRLEIFVEEKSMEEFLRILLPKILSDNWRLDHNYFIRSFEGKNNLQKSLPKQVRAFSYYSEKIGLVVVQDQDSADCKILKSKLSKLILDNSNLPHMIRIVCKELESWYLGDLSAINKAYSSFKYENYQNKAKFRTPDSLNNVSEELIKILPEFQKVTTAKKIAPFLEIHNNRSQSFNQFVSGILKFTSNIKT